MKSESWIQRRDHLHGKVDNGSIQRAASAAGIEKRVTSYALRHSLAASLLEAGGICGRLIRPGPTGSH